MNIFKKYLRKEKSSSKDLVERPVKNVTIEIVKLNKSPNEKNDTLDVSALRNEVLEALAYDSSFMIKAREHKRRMDIEYTFMCFAIEKENTENIVYSKEELMKMLSISLYCLYFNHITLNYAMRIKFNCTDKSANSIRLLIDVS